MTGLPASTIGLIDRGFLAPGMAADVTVFDPTTVADRATFDDPVRPSDGIRQVIVNGQLALQDGKVTGSGTGLCVATFGGHAQPGPWRPEARGDWALKAVGGTGTIFGHSVRTPAPEPRRGPFVWLTTSRGQPYRTGPGPVCCR